MNQLLSPAPFPLRLDQTQLPTDLGHSMEILSEQLWLQRRSKTISSLDSLTHFELVGGAAEWSLGKHPFALGDRPCLFSVAHSFCWGLYNQWPRQSSNLKPLANLQFNTYESHLDVLYLATPPEEQSTLATQTIFFQSSSHDDLLFCRDEGDTISITQRSQDTKLSNFVFTTWIYRAQKLDVIYKFSDIFNLFTSETN